MICRRIDSWRRRSVEQRHADGNPMQQGPQLLESFPLLFGDRRQLYPALERFARVRVHAYMLMVDDFSTLIAIEGDRCPGEVERAPVRVDDDLDATRVCSERRLEITGGRSHRIAALETGERSANCLRSDKWLV